jgi:hypothetical protein
MLAQANSIMQRNKEGHMQNNVFSYKWQPAAQRAHEPIERKI